MGDTQVLSTDKIPKTNDPGFFAIAAFKPTLTPEGLCKPASLRRT
jgi:hypothetical protein